MTAWVTRRPPESLRLRRLESGPGSESIARDEDVRKKLERRSKECATLALVDVDERAAGSLDGRNVTSPSRIGGWLRPRSRWDRLRGLASGLGWRAAIEYLVQSRLGGRPGSVYRLHPRSAIHPVLVRRGSSDLDAFNQIFINREYGSLDDMPGVGLVIDCGANAGYASAWYLSRHPRCHVIAVEPDPANFAILRRNLDAYGSRVTSIRAGVWSRTARLAMSDAVYRDGKEWARQVRVAEPGESTDLEGVDVGTLLASSGHDRISILKMDVEGAEAVIFSAGDRSWLDRVDAIAIELHDDSSFGSGSKAFFAAIGGRGFQVSRRGEITVCRRPG
jgi:FkbM family methyltransferase